MSQDIAHVLDGWDFDPHELNVRVVAGADGKKRLQMRIDLGLLQMTLEGRPDGSRPNGCESLLDYFEEQARDFGDGYYLGADMVEDLFREGWQYYHRYLCLFHLGDYKPVIRDTERNLRMFAFVRKHIKKKRDQWRFEQYRPYVLLMHTRAKAMLALQEGNRQSALESLEEGCQQIQEFLDEVTHAGQKKAECFELEFLRRWHEELSAAEKPTEPKPVRQRTADEGELRRLRSFLEQAIQSEDYEYAAVLRDQIKRLEQTEVHPET